MFKNAKWIAAKDIQKIEPAPLLRKDFAVSKVVKSAKLYACGLGHGIYYINGEKVTDSVLITPISKYDTRVYYDVFDVSRLIKSGENAIGAVLGNGWYFITIYRWDYYRAPWMHHPKMILKLAIEYEDGTVEEIVSDTSWKTHDSAILYNENRRGEIYDARCEIPGWNLPRFDDSLWDNAFICRSPGGKLFKNTIPPIRVTKKLAAKKIGENLYDIGQNISGWVGISVNGEKGASVTVSYAERLHEDGSAAPEYLNTILGSATHKDKYILKGTGTEIWAPNFAYHGFRYAEVEIDGKIDELELWGEVVHTDLAQTGSFESSDEMLNKIHSAAMWSTITNIHGIPTDCPQREQNGWTGDALISAEQTLMSFDAIKLYKKWLLDVCDTQRPSGQICCIAPTGGWGYNWGNGPAWDSLLILLPYYIYYYTGDKSAIRKFRKNMERYMEFLESMSDNNAVCFGLGDWCPPEGTKVCPTEITDTAFFCIDNVVIGKCEELIGKSGEKYFARADEIKADFRRRYIEKSFFLEDNMTAIACCIYNDLYTDEEKPLAAKRLSELAEKNNNHADCGILGMKYIYTALSEYGYADTAYKFTVNPEAPSYAYWILNGMTTLCEKWDMSDSCNHHMYSEVNMWLYKYIAGIRLDEGAKSVTIQPCFVDGIDWVKATHKGISVSWNKNELTLETNIPAKVILNGKIIKADKGNHTFSVK